MPYYTRKQFKPKMRIWHYVPGEAMPIPFTLTDFGRAYLAQLKLMEALAVEAAAAHLSNESLTQPRAARRRR